MNMSPKNVLIAKMTLFWISVTTVMNDCKVVPSKTLPLYFGDPKMVNLTCYLTSVETRAEVGLNIR